MLNPAYEKAAANVRTNLRNYNPKKGNIDELCFCYRTEKKHNSYRRGNDKGIVTLTGSRGYGPAYSEKEKLDER